MGGLRGAGTLLAVALVLVACTDEPPERPADEPATTSTTSTTGTEPEQPVLGASHELLADPEGAGVLLLTGPPEGAAGGGPLTLWRWDGSDWTIEDGGEDGPPARNFFSATYDAARDVVVLYGGDLDATEAARVWEWDGASWTVRQPDGPGPRLAAAMAHDPSTGESVLYGGDDGAGHVLSDTWAWDGRRWRRLANDGPEPARWPAALVADPERSSLVMLGGHQVVDEDLPLALADTWAWRDGAWAEVGGAGGPGRLVNAEAIVHPRLGVLLVGGSGLDHAHGDVWRWDGRRWSLLAEDVFPERQAFGLAHDPDRDVVVLTGGLVRPGDTARHQDVWEWSGDPDRPAVRVGRMG